MKKVILIEDDSDYYDTYKAICDKLGVSCFPETREVFNKLRSSFVVALTSPGEYQEVFQKGRIAEVRKMIATYIGSTAVADILCICDYQLFERKPRVNGINFYEQYLGEEKNVIFVSATISSDEISYINSFCSKKDNRAFIHKELCWGGLEFEDALEKGIYDFMKN